MTRNRKKTIRFSGRNEPVLEKISVCGRVYFALEKLSRRGAFRVFDPHAGPDGDYRILYRFPKSEVSLQQIEVLRRLGGSQANRNFPGITDFASVGHDYIIVVGWVWGTNLRDYLKTIRAKTTPRSSVSEVVRLIRGLVHGVAHYHRRMHIMHGDISPANLILTSGTKQLVLIDFGSAWPMEKANQGEHGHGFTHPYASPERIAQHATEDFRSDAFSLSVIAYELLTLTVPYEGLGGQAGLPKLIAQTENSYRAPSTILPAANRFPRQSLRLLDECVGTSLQLHPDQRYASMNEWISAWDTLQASLKKGSRLNRFEERVLAGIKSLVQIWQKKRS